MLSVTADVSANMKLLRNLEKQGAIEIHVVRIENHTNIKRIDRKEDPILVIGSPLTTIGNSAIASDANKYGAIQRTLGKEHRADALHLERHLESGRDVFVTEDKDFLSKRSELWKEFGVRILTPEELVSELE